MTDLADIFRQENMIVCMCGSATDAARGQSARYKLKNNILSECLFR